jgi:hypothetical protein
MPTALGGHAMQKCYESSDLPVQMHVRACHAPYSAEMIGYSNERRSVSEMKYCFFSIPWRVIHEVTGIKGKLLEVNS